MIYRLILNLSLRITVIAFILIELLGCREPVRDEFPDFVPVPTLNSFLIVDSTIKVQVSLADKMDSMPLRTVDQAEVQLYIDGFFKENLVSLGRGWYSSITIVESGKSYLCNVKIPGYDLVTCSDSVPTPNPILKIEHIMVAGIDEDGVTYPAIKFTVSNNPLEHRYYQAIIRINEYGQWVTANLKEISDPVLLAEGMSMAVFSNDQIKAETYTMLLNYTTGQLYKKGNVWYPKIFPFILELRSISHNYYQYLKQLYLYNLGRYPELLTGASSVFPLYSNVQNGYGIFAGYSTFLSEIITPE